MQPFTDYRFSKEHTWVKPGSDDDAIAGITPFAQEQLGEIVYADLPAIGTTFKKDEVFGSIEALKTTSDLFMPISGTILAVNIRLKDEPNLVNDDALGDGCWSASGQLIPRNWIRCWISPATTNLPIIKDH